MYDYREAIKEDIRNYIIKNTDWEEHTNRNDLEERLQDMLWTEDPVTGNASGSYTFSRSKAQEYILDNLDLLEEACAGLGTDEATVGHWLLPSDFESMDAVIFSASASMKYRMNLIRTSLGHFRDRFSSKFRYKNNHSANHRHYGYFFATF